MYLDHWRNNTLLLFSNDTMWSQRRRIRIPWRAITKLRSNQAFPIKNSIWRNRNIQILGHKRRRRINRNPDNLITRLLEIRIRANQPLSRKRKPYLRIRTFISFLPPLLPYRSNRETTPNRRREGVGGIKSVYLKNRWSPCPSMAEEEGTDSGCSSLDSNEVEKV